jgi:hypothetical protein
VPCAFLRFKKKWWVVLGVLVIGASVGVGVAVASVITTPVVVPPEQANLQIERTSFFPDDGQPEFSSGWKTHPGPVIIQVQVGNLTITQAKTERGPRRVCHPKAVGAGETYIETAQLPVLVTANQEVHWTTSYIIPDHAAPSEDAADRCS